MVAEKDTYKLFSKVNLWRYVPKLQRNKCKMEREVGQMLQSQYDEKRIP